MSILCKIGFHNDVWNKGVGQQVITKREPYKNGPFDPDTHYKGLHQEICIRCGRTVWIEEDND